MSDTPAPIDELYGRPTSNRDLQWSQIVDDERCPFLQRKCIKSRKSEPSQTIGTCTVSHGSHVEPIMICPHRLLDKQKIFFDSIHLLSAHEPGNELHVLSEYSVPGGSIDYVLVSVKDGSVVDFVGIELQTLDTTGTVWPARQRFLADVGILEASDAPRTGNYGLNWKMTAKTILMQMHHKLATFEHVNRKLVLVLQTPLMKYMTKEFNFGHLASPPSLSDSLQFHAYSLHEMTEDRRSLVLDTCFSTDNEGMATALRLQADTNVELETMLRALNSKISPTTSVSIPVDASPIRTE